MSDAEQCTAFPERVAEWVDNRGSTSVTDVAYSTIVPSSYAGFLGYGKLVTRPCKGKLRPISTLLMPSNTSSTCHVSQDRDAGADADLHTLVRMCRSVALTTWSSVLTLLLAAPLRCA